MKILQYIHTKSPSEAEKLKTNIDNFFKRNYV